MQKYSFALLFNICKIWLSIINKNLTSFSNFGNVCLRFLKWRHREVQNRNFLFLLLVKTFLTRSCGTAMVKYYQFLKEGMKHIYRSFQWTAKLFTCKRNAWHYSLFPKLYAQTRKSLGIFLLRPTRDEIIKDLKMKNHQGLEKSSEGLGLMAFSTFKRHLIKQIFVP